MDSLLELTSSADESKEEDNETKNEEPKDDFDVMDTLLVVSEWLIRLSSCEGEAGADYAAQFQSHISAIEQTVKIVDGVVGTVGSKKVEVMSSRLALMYLWNCKRAIVTSVLHCFVFTT